MKHILILSGLMAATALARDTTAPRAPFIARQPLSQPAVANLSPSAELPPLSPALSDPSLRGAFVKMSTAEDGLATLENRIRLLSGAMDALYDAHKRTHQLGATVGKYARVFRKIGDWPGSIFMSRKPMMALK